MTERTADPARTHAVLVGIEKYTAGGEWNRLSGPVRDVLGFHEWLRFRNVPGDQITTLVSPLDENVALVEQSKIKTSPATSVEVLKALNALHLKRGDLLFLFWAGHGVVLEEEHRLFLADATTDHKRNLDLDALQKSLRSSYFPGFPLQIIIVDACANYQRFAFTFPSEPVPCGDPLGHEQFVFFAARPGQVAKNLGEEKARPLLAGVVKAGERGRCRVGHPTCAGSPRRSRMNLPYFARPAMPASRFTSGAATGMEMPRNLSHRAHLRRSSPQPAASPPVRPGLAWRVAAMVSVSRSALAIWRQRLEFMLVEDALCVDPAMKFRLEASDCNEAEEKIRSLGGQGYFYVTTPSPFGSESWSTSSRSKRLPPLRSEIRNSRNDQANAGRNCRAGSR